MSSKKSRVHPRYKTKYRVSNWAEYDRSLVERGSVTLWFSADALAAWTPMPTGRRGGQRKFSDVAIETALTLRLVYHLPLRQAEGFLQSLLGLMQIDLRAPDHTTLSRRSGALQVGLQSRRTSEPMHLIVDSTGLSIMGEGEWAKEKHGGNGKRGRKKLHLGVDATGLIVAQILTDGNADDAATVPQLLDQIDGEIALFVADAAYDTRPVYRALKERGATVVVLPVKPAVSGHQKKSDATDRDKTIARVREVGRRQWMKESGYHRQARVENAFFRYKTILGGRLRARTPAAGGEPVVFVRSDNRQGDSVALPAFVEHPIWEHEVATRLRETVEARVACRVLNRMTELGRPKSFAVGA